MTHPTEAPMANAIDDVKGEPDYFAVHSVTGSHIGLWKDETFARNVLKEYVGGTITPLYRASPAPSQHTGWSDEAVSKALRKLAAEVGGLRTFEGELRAELGNTNWSVLMLRLAEADAALAASSIAPATRMPHSGVKVSDIVAMIDADTIAPATGFEVKTKAASGVHFWVRFPKPEGEADWPVDWMTMWWDGEFFQGTNGDRYLPESLVIGTTVSAPGFDQIASPSVAKESGEP